MYSYTYSKIHQIITTMSTRILRIKKDNRFTILPNETLQDSRLSFSARGILAYVFSRPDDWTINVNDIINNSDMQKAGVRTKLKELRTLGYATIECTYTPAEGGQRGKISSYYLMSEVPITDWILKHHKQQTIKRQKAEAAKKIEGFTFSKNEFDAIFTKVDHKSKKIKTLPASDFLKATQERFQEEFKNNFGVGFTFSKGHTEGLKNLLIAIYPRIEAYCKSIKEPTTHKILMQGFETVLRKASKQIDNRSQYTPSFILSVLHTLR